jgi:DNA-binding beta-propeller fold protein YncE
VADFENTRIQKFDALGQFLTQWPTESPVGPTGLAVDSAGHVYVLNHRHHDHYVQKFDTSGRLVAEWGANGSGPGEFIASGSGGPGSVAVDAGGSVYATDPNNHRVQKFDADRNFLAAFGSIGQGAGQFIDGAVWSFGRRVGSVDATDLIGRVQKFDGSSGRSAAGWEVAWVSRLIATDDPGDIFIRYDIPRSVVKYRQR